MQTYQKSNLGLINKLEPSSDRLFCFFPATASVPDRWGHRGGVPDQAFPGRHPLRQIQLRLAKFQA